MIRTQRQSLRLRSGVTIFPDIEIVLVAMFMCFINVYWAYVTIKSWCVGTSNPLVADGFVDQILTIFIFLFISSIGVCFGKLLLFKMTEHPSGYPVRGHSIVTVLIWICGTACAITIAGIVSSWFGMSGATS